MLVSSALTPHSDYLELLYLEIPLSQDNLLEQLAVWGKEFSLSLELKITSFAGSGLSSVLQLSNEGPQVFLNHDTGNKIREVQPAWLLSQFCVY